MGRWLKTSHGQHRGLFAAQVGAVQQLGDPACAVVVLEVAVALARQGLHGLLDGQPLALAQCLLHLLIRRGLAHSLVGHLHGVEHAVRVNLRAAQLAHGGEHPEQHRQGVFDALGGQGLSEGLVLPALGEKVLMIEGARVLQKQQVVVDVLGDHLGQQIRRRWSPGAQPHQEAVALLFVGARGVP